jgi:hypothetical protein
MKLDLSTEVRNAIEGMMAELQLLGMKPEGCGQPPRNSKFHSPATGPAASGGRVD